MAASRVPRGVGAGAGAVDVPLPAAREMGDAAGSSSLLVSHHLKAIRREERALCKPQGQAGRDIR